MNRSEWVAGTDPRGERLSIGTLRGTNDGKPQTGMAWDVHPSHMTFPAIREFGMGGLTSGVQLT